MSGRLEEIKKGLTFLANTEYKIVTLGISDYNHIIKRAERVEELEYQNDVLSESLGDMPGMQKRYIKNIEQQNQCYREILDEVLTEYGKEYYGLLESESNG